MDKDKKTFEKIYRRYDGKYGDLVEKYCILLKENEQLKKKIKYAKLIAKRKKK